MGKKERYPEAQLRFIAPEDAVMVHLLRRFVAEASRIYETRTGHAVEENLVVHSPEDAYEFLRLEMENLEQEQFRAIHLNTRHRILSTQLIYQGSLNSTSVRIAEVFRPAIIDNATGLIVCHNHPSGAPRST